MKPSIYDTHATAAKFIAAGRSKTDRPVANNTRLVLYPDGQIGLRFHRTDVVTYWPDGDVSFNSGGWPTMSTKDRMNYHPAFSVWTDKGVWYVHHRKAAERTERRIRDRYGLPREWESESGYVSPRLGTMGARSRAWGFWGELAELLGHKDAYRIYRAFEAEVAEKCRYLFFDGIRFDKRGKCLNGLTPAQSESKVAESERLRLRIREYAKAAIRHLHEGVALGGEEPYSEITEFDYTYLTRIMDDGAYPPRLYFDAMEESKYNPTGRAMHLGERFDDDLGRYVIGGTVYRGQRGERYAASGSTVGNAIYKFMCKRLLPDRETRDPFRMGDLAGV